MSEKGKKSRKRASKAAVKTRSRPRKILKLLFFLLALIVIIILLTTILLWFNRQAVITHYVDKALQSYGLEAEYEVSQLTKTRSVLSDITLSKDDTRLVSAESLDLRYNWREAMKGRFLSISVIGADAVVHINERGRLSLPGQSTGNENNGDFRNIMQALPPGGIGVGDATVKVISPYGGFDASMNATITSPEIYEADIAIAQTKIDYQGYQLDGKGAFTVKRDNNPSEFDGVFELNNMAGHGMTLGPLKIVTQFQPEEKDGVWTLTGAAQTEFTALKTPELTAKSGRLDWDGMIRMKAGDIRPDIARGDWSITAGQAGLANPERRRNFARRLSLAEPLSKAPVAQNFGPSLTAHMQRLMTLSDISAKGRLSVQPGLAELSLDAPASLTGERSSLTLDQTDWAPLYRYEKARSEVRLAFHAEMENPVGLKMRETEIVAASQNGWKFDAVNRFRADVQTRRTWRRNLGTVFGQARVARISPFRADVVYENEPSGRSLTLKGAVDFDGPLPGGFATGLKSAGRLDLDLDDPTLSMTYQPDNNDPITVTRFDTDTVWHAEDIKFTLLSKTPIFKRRGNRSTIDARLGQLAFIAIDDTGTKNLGMTFDRMDAQGVLSGQNISQGQNWTLNGSNAKICSEDTPGPGTEIHMPDMAMTVSREGKAAPQFVLTSPKADAKTSLVDAKGLVIDVKGQPDQYRLNYQNGDVKFSGEALPRLPMSGYVDFESGIFSGEAGTYLPRTQKTPIDIDYRFEGGVGSAVVDIPYLAFTSRGLQPQDLIPALRGKIADVNGETSAKINLSFTAGSPVQSNGTADINLATLGTLPGPLANVNTSLGFSSFFPLQSRGFHTVTIGSFDPGLPLSDGIVEYALIPDGVQIRSARWPIGGGYVSMQPMSWLYSARENRVTLNVENVSLGAFVDRDFGTSKLKATGLVNGTIPITLAGVNVTADGGLLTVKDGGTIQYVSAQTRQASAENEYADMAFRALENLEYKTLEARFNGPLDGKLDVRLEFEGKNKDVLAGQPFLFDISVEGELMKLMRDLDPNSYVDRLRPKE